MTHPTDPPRAAGRETEPLRTFCIYCAKPFVGTQQPWTLQMPMGDRGPLHRGCAPKLHRLLRKEHGDTDTIAEATDA